jgi:hypothetical protein
MRGVRQDGVTTAENEELVRVRREKRRLKIERVSWQEPRLSPSPPQRDLTDEWLPSKMRDAAFECELLDRNKSHSQ